MSDELPTETRDSAPLETAGRVFWGGTALAYPFEDRCRAAVAGGFTSITVFPHDCAPPLGAEGIRALADAHNLTVAALDGYTRWGPRWKLTAGADGGVEADLAALLGTTEDEFFALAETLGAESLNMFEVFGTEYPLEELVEQFGHMCDRAADCGRRVTLEFTPLGSIRDIGIGWAVVSGADRPNGGLLLDTWHYYRGGANDDLLERIPGDRFFHVQVNDGPTEPRGATVMEDTMHYRYLPGEGDWPIVELLGQLQSKPGIGPFGIEVFNDDLMKLPPEEIGRRSGDALRRVLRSA